MTGVAGLFRCGHTRFDPPSSVASASPRNEAHQVTMSPATIHVLIFFTVLTPLAVGCWLKGGALAFDSKDAYSARLSSDRGVFARSEGRWVARCSVEFPPIRRRVCGIMRKGWLV